MTASNSSSWVWAGTGSATSAVTTVPSHVSRATGVSRVAGRTRAVAGRDGQGGWVLPVSPAGHSRYRLTVRSVPLCAVGRRPDKGGGPGSARDRAGGAPVRARSGPAVRQLPEGGPAP
ncbi:hypothetical protein GCM10010505_50930 [Kitasatospora aburaviensis]